MLNENFKNMYAITAGHHKSQLLIIKNLNCNVIMQISLIPNAIFFFNFVIMIAYLRQVAHHYTFDPSSYSLSLY